MEEIVVKGDLGSLPGERVDSVFGFEKSILETARSASTVSEEMMDRFNMQDIDELVVLAPGTFTQSFFRGLQVLWMCGEQRAKPIFEACEGSIIQAIIRPQLAHLIESILFVDRLLQFMGHQRLVDI